MSPSALYTNRKIQLTLSLASLAVAFYVLTAATLDWPFGIIDSPILIAQAMLYSPLEYFTSPEAYQFLSYNNYTPLVTLSWDIDYSLFGLEARAYRLHHMLALLAVVAASYLLIYRVSHSLLSATVFSFAILNLPGTYSILELLVNRHYLEGMLFSLLSFYFFQAYMASNKNHWLIFSVLCYAVSITAKEVYIPLPGILFFLLQGSLQTRLRRIAPYAVVLCIYLGLRFHILSGTGGYSAPQDSLGILGNLDLLYRIAVSVVNGLFFHPAFSWTLLIMFTALLVWNLKQLAHRKWAILIGAAGLVLPLIALLPMLSVGFLFPRWLFAPAVALVLCLSYLCSISKSRLVQTVVCLVVFSGSAYAYYERIQAPTPAHLKAKGVTYKEILASKDDSFLLFSRFSELSANGHSIWVYIAKLHNGTWGTLSLSFPEQLQYHDVSHKKVIPLGKKARRANTRNVAPVNLVDVIKASHYDAGTGLLTVDMVETLSGKHCIVYIFGEHNGLLFDLPDCTQWRVQSQELTFQLRRIGYDLDNTSLAIWSTGQGKTVYSTPYTMNSLL